MHEVLAKSGINTAPGDVFNDYLSAQGFANVQNKIMNGPARRGRKNLGKMHRQNILMWVEGLSMRLLTKQLGWTKEEFDDHKQEVRQDLEGLEKHYESIMFDTENICPLIL